MQIDWQRRLSSFDENRPCVECLKAVVAFFHSMESTKHRVDSHAQIIHLRRIIDPIVLSCIDAHKADDTVTIGEANLTEDFSATNGIGWIDIESILFALRSVDAIRFDPTIEPYQVQAGPPIDQWIASGNPNETQENLDETAVTDSNSAIATEAEGKPDNPLDYFRYLNVHTWSDFPQVNTFVDEIFSSLFAEKDKGGIKRKHVKVVLLNLYVNWSIDPKLYTAFFRDVSRYDAHSLYNMLHISRMTIPVVDRLVAGGLVQQAKGFFDPTWQSRASRIWPTERIIEKFAEAKFGPLDIDAHFGEECIVLRKSITKKRKKRGTDKYETYQQSEDHQYRDEDYDQIVPMRAQLTRYNELLRRSFIDIPTLERPYIELKVKKGRLSKYLLVNQNDKFVRRVFNRGSFEKGGRFWGGWWQRCPKEWRKSIFINDDPTSEIDYSGLHIVMLYALEGIDYWREFGEDDDPYTIDLPELEKTVDDIRSVCKELLLVALNAKNERSAFSAFRHEAENGSVEKKLTNKQLKPALDQLRIKHSKIEHKFASDAGIDLMRKDSDITALVMDEFAKDGIPVLTIHDSYIVPRDHHERLERTMERAFERITGVPNIQIKSINQEVGDVVRKLRGMKGYIPNSGRVTFGSDTFLVKRTERYSFQVAQFQHWLSSLRD